MDNRYLKLNVITIQKEEIPHTTGVVLLFGLDGMCTVLHGQNETVLTRDQILLLQPEEHCTISGEAVLACFEIPDRTIRNLFCGRQYRFRCDSTKEENDNFSVLRKYMRDLLQVRYETPEYQTVLWNRAASGMLLFLVQNFSVIELPVKQENTPENRIGQILQYLEDNYQEELSLDIVSGQFHMTPQYFSRFFSKYAGISYHRYISQVRLSHAVEELLSEDRSMLQIAIDNGFPNQDAFRKLFSQVYQMTPQEYVRKEKEKQAQKDAVEKAVLNRLLKDSTSSSDDASDDMLLCADARHMETCHAFWNRLMNLEDAGLLENYSAREQFRQLQEATHFQSLRIRLPWMQYHREDVYSFYREEAIFDFLIELHISPWFFVSSDQLADLDRICAYLRRLLAHFINRYGQMTVRSWRFELVYETVFTEEHIGAYWNGYDRLSRILSEFDLSDRLCGAGLRLGEWQGIGLFESYMERTHRKLPVQTIRVEPLTFDLTQDTVAVRKNTDASYMRNQIRTYEMNFPGLSQDSDIYITDWSDSFTDINILNDLCYRGAAIIKSVIDCFGMVSGMAHNGSLDMSYTDHIQDRVLFGGNGLISKQGLRKPSFFAYLFLQYAGPYFVAKSRNAIIFRNDSQFQVLCHNCQKPGYRCYDEHEPKTYRNQGALFEDMETLDLKIRLDNLENGSYIVKRQTVNQHCGSIADETWRLAPDEGLDMPNYLTEDTEVYLKRITVPRMSLKSFLVKDHTLSFGISLEANEFACLEITRFIAE